MIPKTLFQSDDRPVYFDRCSYVGHTKLFSSAYVHRRVSIIRSIYVFTCLVKQMKKQNKLYEITKHSTEYAIFKCFSWKQNSL